MDAAPARAAGVTRRVDRLGRVVLPAELRRRLRISEGDLVDIQVIDECMVISKVETGCIFCGDCDLVQTHHGRAVCRECIDAVKSL